MNKIKWHYAVMRSIFGNFWVGKTKAKLQKEIVFVDIQDAIEKAKYLFETRNPDFDVEAFENEEGDNSYEAEEEYRTIIETTEDNIEEIQKGSEKFIVNNY